MQISATSSEPIRVLELRSVRGAGGGPEKTILLGAARASAGVHVTVCYLRDARDRDFALDERAAGAGVTYVEVVERHSFDPRVVAAVRRLVRERSIDIVHAHEYKTDALAWVLGRLERVIPMATAHGWTGDSWKEQHVYYPADRRILRTFPRVVAVSEDIRRELIACGAAPARVTTVLNAVDPEEFRRDRGHDHDARAALGLPQDAYVIGAVGRVEAQKRFDLLIEAFADAAMSRPRLHLVIAGGGSRLPDLQRQAEALGPLAARIHLLGHRTDVPSLHHAFDAFVQSSDYEGTPNAVLEAMAFDNPVVATRAGGTAEILTDGVHGRLVDPGDRGALTQALADLCNAPDVAREWAHAARRRVETELSFSTRLARVEAIYATLVAERRAR